jgi:hypothetical protein
MRAENQRIREKTRCMNYWVIALATALAFTIGTAAAAVFNLWHFISAAKAA